MITYSFISVLGNRSINEDYVGMLDKGNSMIFALADGLGGHGKGELASKLIVDTVLLEFKNSNSYDNLLERAFVEAQNVLMDEQIRLGAINEMKSTLACLHLTDSTARWAHVGDSRLYLFRKNKIIFKTFDHSVPQMLFASGEIKEKDIRFHEDRNRLIRAMGMKWDTAKYELSKEIPTLINDSFLLCSDGFWEWIVERDMIKLLKKSITPKQWLELMEKHILSNGKNKNMDNYSAIAVFVR